jgi:hypothetical protein
MASEKQKTKMTKGTAVRIIEEFHVLFPGELEFELEGLILNEVGSFDNLIIVPEKLDPIKILEKLEKTIEVNYFLEPLELCEKINFSPRRNSAYALLLEDVEGEEEVKREESINLFEGLLGFLLGALRENYCTGSEIKDEPDKHPYFLHQDRDGSILIVNISKKNKFLPKTKRIKKIIPL